MEITSGKTIIIDIDDFYDDKTCDEQVEYVAEKLNEMSPWLFSQVIEQLDREKVITCFTAEEICDNADERELVEELISRGWKLVEDDE